MSKNSKYILNEVSFYQHNGGTKMNKIFKKYIKSLGPERTSLLSYKRFTGKKRGSFRSYIVRTDGHSQASNFLYNTPSFDRRGRRVAGSLASTANNMKIIKRALTGLKNYTKSMTKVNSKQNKYLNKINSKEGFAKLCSHY